MPNLTLITDFGLQDGYAGVLKGVIWGICPEAQIADISHTIAPQDVLAAALTLRRVHAYFPSGTIHVAVVDPGVGTTRRPLAARLGAQYYVAPDNGLLTPIIEEAEKNGWAVEFVHTNNPKYWLPLTSHTFHGRDIFAPVGAHLAKGTPLSDLGTVITDPVRLNLSAPEPTAFGWNIHVTGIDVFGNLATDLPADGLPAGQKPVFRLHGRQVRGMVAAYGLRPAGELVALTNSEGYVEIAAVNGSAARLLGAKVGETIEVRLE